MFLVLYHLLLPVAANRQRGLKAFTLAV